MKTFKTLFVTTAIYVLFGTQIVLAVGNGIVVFQSDFGLRDQAVSAMHGVALGVDKNLKVEDLTHDIPAYNIWEGAYRLDAVADFWPEHTVFVSVVDPGVGSDRKSVVLKTKTNHYFVTPDNGTLTLVAKRLGIAEVREIDEKVNRLKDSEASHTFHGRDVYAYTGARLAANKILFEKVGPKLPDQVLNIQHETARIEGKTLIGGIPILDPAYGNVWTNVPMALLLKLSKVKSYSELYTKPFSVTVTQAGKTVLLKAITFERSFAGVNEGEPLLYVNSLENLALALNQDNFADKFKISAGGDWRIEIRAK
ncbi:S-adenosyl-l-methionine hydroxide adenosyltransferase family protein [Paraglaciecola aquimarina]|uniref:S-adenosyl-l-methionine hydroxide adenosyltransferase family protein n=1 Tax=Paraglaciecola algarum TaxID=3050085 RepID=A0ABS9D8P5_9ALTE|nr:S-adenosyl-l-methionine hydroxide adenosyltransferase family protein [Paraglaciecola sp. G1-23]MCF2948174.1 S-adenosyl-l-methionine hydroxide adenosyltransferase family protein [Paraglaciecola sp. G1-23]